MDLMIDFPQIYRRADRLVLMETTTCEEGEPIRLAERDTISDRGLLKKVQQGSRRYVEKLCETLMQAKDPENAKMGHALYEALLNRKIDYLLSVTYMKNDQVLRVEVKEFEL